MTLKNGTRINIPEPNEPEEGESLAAKEIFNIGCDNHAKLKCNIEENISKSFSLIIGQPDIIPSAKIEA